MLSGVPAALNSLRLATLSAFLLLTTATQAQDFVWAPDFPVGASIPSIDAPDQDGNNRRFADLVGEKGLLLVFSRSFDW
jgi:hypothetical protein